MESWVLLINKGIKIEKYVDIEDLVGKILIKAEKNGDAELNLTSDDGYVYTFYHVQDCCEDVHIESIVGDLKDLIGFPILNAECVSNHENNSEIDSSVTWTFYKLATIKGYVDIRWIGSSNGYYSEEVSILKEKK